MSATSTSTRTSSTSSSTSGPLTDLSMVEVIESLTGYEELAIKSKFGGTIGGLFDDSVSMGKRALVFTLYARQDNGPRDAYKAAMGLTVKQLDGCFGSDDEDDDLPGAEESEVGEGEPAGEPRLTS